MSEKLTDKVAFDFIRYANCWEDAEILLEGLSINSGDKILSVGSAGDNSFSMLTKNPSLVVAVDINPIQLFVIELKKAAYKQLEYEELLGFLGFCESTNRLTQFDEIKPFLSENCLQYWESNTETIEKGIISQGKFERYFQLFTSKILPWIHTKKRTEALLLPKSAEEQIKFYEKTWNTWRWRLLFKIFFSRYVMGKFGRDPQFLNQVKISVGTYIFNKAAHHLRSTQAQHNFILRYNLTGNFGELLPHYMRRENWEIIRENIDKLKIRQGYAEDAFSEFGNFNAMNLSNIFEYMDGKTFSETGLKLAQHLIPGGKMAYWNLMVPRKISEIHPDKLDYLRPLSEELTSRDNGFFYNQFIIEKRK